MFKTNGFNNLVIYDFLDSFLSFNFEIEIEKQTDIIIFAFFLLLNFSNTSKYRRKTTSLNATSTLQIIFFF